MILTGSDTYNKVQFCLGEVHIKKKKEDFSNTAKILGNNIKQIRTLEKLSQEELAEKIGKSSHFISLVERGESGLSVNTIIDICKALNTDTNSIFAGIVKSENTKLNSFLSKSFDTFECKDKEMVLYLINYIISSKS